MNRFAELLDRLAYEPSRNNKLRLMADYFPILSADGRWRRSPVGSRSSMPNRA
jgi:hypothetical protein